MNVQKNRVEWAVFAASLVIVGACVALLIVSMTRSADAPPDLRLSVGEPQRAANGFMVPVRIHNAGDHTAEQVVAEVTLLSGEKEVERAELTFAFVPRRSERHAVVLFRQDPRCCRIEARALGFGKP